MLIILAFGRLGKEDCEGQAILACIARPYF